MGCHCRAKEIIMDKKEAAFLFFVGYTLHDEHGISETAYNALLDCLSVYGMLYERDFLQNHVQATDGRFYLPEMTRGWEELVPC
jgi:hypothetical protein